MLAIAAAALGFVVALSPPARAVEDGPISGHAARTAGDPAKIVGVKSCSECHEDAVEVWKNTSHYAGAASLPRSSETRRIAAALGIRRVKAAAACVSCHYTVVAREGGEPKAAYGVSCESCHGAARDWLEIHDKYGGPEVAREGETEQHKAQRLSECDDLGMRRAGRIVELAAACFACHTTPDERIVNVGGHPPGGDFELVSSSQGRMRHNYWRGPRDSNPESSPERKRLLYVIGRALELESALRGLAAATEEGPYALHVRRRVRSAIGALEEIEALVPLPEVGEMLRNARGVALRIGNQEAASAAVAKIRASAAAFAERYSGEELAAIDPGIPRAIPTESRQLGSSGLD